MKERTVSFEKLLENSCLQDFKKAAADLHKIYEIFIEAGFSDNEALTLIVALMNSGRHV